MRLHLRRQGHEIIVDGADQDHRPFDQPGDLLQQRLIRNQPEPDLLRLAFRIPQNAPFPLFPVEHDVVVEQLPFVIGEARYNKTIRPEEAMPDRTGADVESYATA